MIEKIKAVMIGHAVGDALGVPVEFCERDELKDAPVTDMKGYGTYHVPAGAWSDDTSMSLAAMDVLANGKVDWLEIMINFTKWLDKGDYTPTGISFDVGRTCLAAICTFMKNCYSEERGFCLPEDFEITECGQNGECSNGNGSLMRIHPFVLYAYYNKLNHWQCMKFLEKASRLTHSHDRSVMGCYIYSYCMESLLREQSKESLRSAIDFAGKDLDHLPEFEHYKRLFRLDFEKLPADEIRSSGYVVDTLEAALWCVLTTESYKECELKAVNLGEDADTVAAVAGGLAGALYGYDSIPDEWKNKLIKRKYIEEMCERAENSWNMVEG